MAQCDSDADTGAGVVSETMADKTDMIHASCVAWQGQAVLIRGVSGSGKSGLALELMAYGCVLVSDDQTCVKSLSDGLWASAPAPLEGLIEARQLGLLRADFETSARVALVVDLDQTEQHRLPEHHSVTILGYCMPVLHKVESRYFAAGILQYLKAGRRD